MANPFNLSDLFNAVGQFTQQAQPVQQQALQGTQRMLQGIPSQNAPQSWDQYNQATIQSALNQMRPGTSYGLTAPQAMGLAALGEPNRINAPGVGSVDFGTYKNIANAAMAQQSLNDRAAQGFSNLAQQGVNKLNMENEIVNSPIAQRVASPEMMRTQLGAGFTMLDSLMNAPQQIAANIDRTNPNMSPTERLETLNQYMSSFYNTLGSPDLAKGIQQAIHAPDSQTVDLANQQANKLGLTMDTKTTQNQEMAKLSDMRTQALQSQPRINANYNNLLGFQKQVQALPSGTVTSDFSPVIKQILGNSVSLGPDNHIQIIDSTGRAHNYDPANDNLAAMMPNLTSPLTGQPYVTPDQINGMIVKTPNGYALNGERMKELMDTVSAKAFEDNIKAMSLATPGGFRDIDNQFSLGLGTAQRAKLQSANWVPAEQVINNYTKQITDQVNNLASKYQDKNGLINGQPAKDYIRGAIMQAGSQGQSLQATLNNLNQIFSRNQ